MREGQSSFLGKTVLKPSLEVISKRIIIPHIKKMLSAVTLYPGQRVLIMLLAHNWVRFGH